MPSPDSYLLLLSPPQGPLSHNSAEGAAGAGQCQAARNACNLAGNGDKDTQDTQTEGQRQEEVAKTPESRSRVVKQQAGGFEGQTDIFHLTEASQTGTTQNRNRLKYMC